MPFVLDGGDNETQYNILDYLLSTDGYYDPAFADVLAQLAAILDAIFNTGTGIRLRQQIDTVNTHLYDINENLNGIFDFLDSINTKLENPMPVTIET